MSFSILFMISEPDCFTKGLNNRRIIQAAAFLTDVFVRFIWLPARLPQMVKSIGNCTDSGNDRYILSAYHFGIIPAVITIMMETAEI